MIEGYIDLSSQLFIYLSSCLSIYLSFHLSTYACVSQQQSGRSFVVTLGQIEKGNYKWFKLGVQSSIFSLAIGQSMQISKDKQVSSQREVEGFAARR